MSCVIYLDSIEKKEALNKISEYLHFEIVKKVPVKGAFLDIKDNGLCFTLNSENPSNYLNIDFLSGSMGWRLKRADHERLLKKTLGKNIDTLTIFDGTAGFLSDAMIFLAQGHKIIACEQSKIVYLLVKDALARAKGKIPYLQNLEFLNDSLFALQFKCTPPDKQILSEGKISYAWLDCLSIMSSVIFWVE